MTRLTRPFIASVMGLLLAGQIAVRASGQPVGRPTFIDVHPITADTGDGYRYVPYGRDGLKVIASPQNHSANTRHVVIDSTNTVRSMNQKQCVTWRGPLDEFVQPGIALRIRTDVDGRTRAITVTSNIWSFGRNAFNVHLADSGATPAMHLLGQFTPPGFAPSADHVEAPPWRLCARVDLERLQLMVWAPRHHPPPRWGDPAFGATMRLPRSEVVVGNSGLYIGHLAPTTDVQRFTGIRSDDRSTCCRRRAVD